eukprot:1177945-Prorocentrum_minimum.AAC.1
MNGTQVGCQSGNRSKGAAAALSAAGYKVFEVEGGYSAWESAQLPVTGGTFISLSKVVAGDWGGFRLVEKGYMNECTRAGCYCCRDTAVGERPAHER